MDFFSTLAFYYHLSFPPSQIYVNAGSLKENKIRIKTDYFLSKLHRGKQVAELVFITRKNNLFIISSNYPENLTVEQMEQPDKKPWNPGAGRLKELKQNLK